MVVHRLIHMPLHAALHMRFLLFAGELEGPLRRPMMG